MEYRQKRKRVKRPGCSPFWPWFWAPSRVLLRSGVFGSIVFILLFFLSGCAEHSSDSGSVSEKTFLIRIGESVVSTSDFESAFEIAKAAYPYNSVQDPNFLQRLKRRLLNEMTEELILLERARELDIRVSDSEVEKRIGELKKEFPDGVFDKMLLEDSISYQSWKQRLKVRLTMEKVIEKEISQKVMISMEDFTNYVEKMKKENAGTLVQDKTHDLGKAIVAYLRREKTEKAYTSWLKTLQNRYKIELNNGQWEKIAGTKATKTADPSAAGRQPG
jgi:hypothetical protein